MGNICSNREKVLQSGNVQIVGGVPMHALETEISKSKKAVKEKT